MSCQPWSIAIFLSTAIDCGPPGNPGPNGAVSVDMTTFGNMATYSCDPGYELRPDNSVRTCQADGTWSGMDPLCERMNYAIYGIKMILHCWLLIRIP